MNKTVSTLVVCAGLVPLGLYAGTDLSGHGAATQEAAIETWKEELEAMAGGVWIASNADYAEADGAEGPDEYGMAFAVQPGGLSATGCLWGERDGELVAVYWRLFQGWDPTRNAGLFYQSHPAGIVGIGYGEDGGPDEPHVVQDFRQPDGTMGRVGHFERWDGPDTRVSRSVDWSGTEWTPRRQYTWVRVRDRESPC